MFTAAITPARGLIPAKSTIDVSVSLTALRGSLLEHIFVLNVKHMRMPLGFEVTAEVKGLTVSFESLELSTAGDSKHKPKIAEENDNTNLFNSLVMKSNVKNSHLLRSMRGSTIFHALETTQRLARQSNASEASLIASAVKKEVVSLEFLGCEINKPKSMYLLLTNTSGLPTSFTIGSSLFQPHVKDKKHHTITAKSVDRPVEDDDEDELQAEEKEQEEQQQEEEEDQTITSAAAPNS